MHFASDRQTFSGGKISLICRDSWSSIQVSSQVHKLHRNPLLTFSKNVWQKWEFAGGESIVVRFNKFRRNLYILLPIAQYPTTITDISERSLRCSVVAAVLNKVIYFHCSKKHVPLKYFYCLPFHPHHLHVCLTQVFMYCFLHKKRIKDSTKWCH